MLPQYQFAEPRHLLDRPGHHAGTEFASPLRPTRLPRPIKPRPAPAATEAAMLSSMPAPSGGGTSVPIWLAPESSTASGGGCGKSSKMDWMCFRQAPRLGKRLPGPAAVLVLLELRMEAKRADRDGKHGPAHREGTPTRNRAPTPWLRHRAAPALGRHQQEGASWDIGCADEWRRHRLENGLGQEDQKPSASGKIDGSGSMPRRLQRSNTSVAVWLRTNRAVAGSGLAHCRWKGTFIANPRLPDSRRPAVPPIRCAASTVCGPPVIAAGP